MKCVFFFLLVSLFSVSAQESIIAEGAKPVAVSQEFKFTEGPAVDKDGNVYFTDQPNDRIMIKAMSEKWGRKVTSKELYDLFPGKPSKQAGQIAGLPESRRKGGY